MDKDAHHTITYKRGNWKSKMFVLWEDNASSVVNLNDEKYKWFFAVRIYIIGILTHRCQEVPDENYFEQIFECLLCADVILDSGDEAVNKRDRSIPWPPGAYVLMRKSNQSIFKNQVSM